MRHNRLLNLLARNARKGEFRADTSEGGNVIWLYDQIVACEADAEWWGGCAADTFAKALAGMSGPVLVRINCPGGDVFAGRAMAQAIREYAGEVTAQVDGYAASAATFITSAADRTTMAPGSMLMIHKAWTLGFGNADDFLATAALLEKIDGTIANSYTAAAEKRGKEAPDWAALMAAETWLDEHEAIDLGLADEVTTGADKQSTASARARWDLSAYTHAPAAASAAQVPAVEVPPAPVIEPSPAPVAEVEPVQANERERRQRQLQVALLEAA
jgi:ATP-dependent Clp protease protease subunit